MPRRSLRCRLVWMSGGRNGRGLLCCVRRLHIRNNHEHKHKRTRRERWGEVEKSKEKGGEVEVEVEVQREWQMKETIKEKHTHTFKIIQQLSLRIRQIRIRQRISQHIQIQTLHRCSFADNNHSGKQVAATLSVNVANNPITQ